MIPTISFHHAIIVTVVMCTSLFSKNDFQNFIITAIVLILVWMGLKTSQLNFRHSIGQCQRCSLHSKQTSVGLLITWPLDGVMYSTAQVSSYEPNWHWEGSNGDSHKWPDEIFIVSSGWSEELLQVDDGFLLSSWCIIEKDFIYSGLRGTVFVILTEEHIGISTNRETAGGGSTGWEAQCAFD